MTTNTYKDQIVAAIAGLGILSAQECEQLISIPPDTANGNFTLPCFSLAKQLRKAPKIIAEDIASQISLSSDFSKIEPVNGYLNFYLDASVFIKGILESIHSSGIAFGHAPANGKTVVIDYSSPNIGKELAFHHLRSTMIGNSLSRIFAAYGYTVIRINHLGDWGTQFGKLIVMYLREQLATTPEALSQLDIKDLNVLYAGFSKAVLQEPQLEQQARDAFTKLEQGDAFYTTLWTAFKEATLKELNRLYEMMGVGFDYYTGESFFNDKMDEVVQLLEQKQLLQRSQERDVVHLDQEDMPPCLIRKSDGSTLYATRDLAAALYRMREYHFDECLYVVDNGQSLHFKQVFTVLQKMGYDWSKQMEHIPFGLILHQNEDGKWEKGKTRTGTASLLRDVFEGAKEKILAYINEKNPQLDNKEELALQIGVSALTFNDLKNRRLMDIKFDWDQALSFEGSTGPYVQNAHVRLCSIMRKAGRTVAPEQVNYSALTGQYEYELIQLINRMPQRIRQACESREPYILAQFSLEIAEYAHRFLHNCRVLGSAEETDRLFLTQCTQLALENVLTLIGVVPIRQM